MIPRTLYCLHIDQRVVGIIWRRLRLCLGKMNWIGGTSSLLDSYASRFASKSEIRTTPVAAGAVWGVRLGFLAGLNRAFWTV